ncbi:hypothetical protein XENOCAPTIV_011746, partial [Xenoophorus captivus]
SRFEDPCAFAKDWAAADTLIVLDHLNRLDLCVNRGKSALVPSQVMFFYRCCPSSRAMTACAAPQRVARILEVLPMFLPGRAPLLIAYLRLLGMETAAFAVVPLVLLSLCPLQMWLNASG